MSRILDRNKFIQDVVNSQYALVVGNEILLDESVESTRDVHQYFLRRIEEEYNERYSNYYEIALDKSERINPIRKIVEEKKITYDVKCVSKDLFALLNTRLFTTILTTTTDGFLEMVLREIWGGELRVVNVYDKETITDFQNSLKECRTNNYTQTTLVYLFGKMDTDSLGKKYVKTDSDAIEAISKWMRMDIEGNNDLLNFIRSKRLLALGCRYDNWYFRFFWYVLTGISKTNDDNEFDGRGEVAFNKDVKDCLENKLLQFLDRTDIYMFPDALACMKDITTMMTDESNSSIWNEIIKKKRSVGNRSIFISYCSKDELTAIQLFAELCDKGYKVWLDKASLYGGDDYEIEIDKAISASKIVITLLSPEVADDLKNGKNDHYYNKEWQIARQNDRIIIPLAINGYDLRNQEYHSEYERIIGKTISGVDLMTPDGNSSLIASIDKHLQV